MYSDRRMYSSNFDLTQPMEGPVDRPSGQLLNDEVDIAQMGRTRVRSQDRYDPRVAEDQMRKHLRRRRRSAPVKFLVDRMRFTKRGYHKYLPYRDIEHFYQPPGEPESFVLFTRDRKGRRSYETYRCNSPEDVERVKDLINYAGHDRQKLLNGSEYSYHLSSRPESRTSTISSEYVLQQRPVSRVSTVAQPTQYNDVYYSTVEQQPVVVYQTRTSRPVSAEPRYEFRRALSIPATYKYVAPSEPVVQTQRSYLVRRSVTPSRQSLVSVKRTVDPDDSITYLRSDKVHGPEIVKDGPVYMYLTRSPQSVASANGYAETAPVTYLQ